MLYIFPHQVIFSILLSGVLFFHFLEFNDKAHRPSALFHKEYNKILRKHRISMCHKRLRNLYLFWEDRELKIMKELLKTYHYKLCLMTLIKVYIN